MHKTSTLIPLALWALSFAAVAQEPPRVLFCKGECYGVDNKGTRIPVTKGTRIAPGLRLETGPNSYMQVKLGRDAAFGMGESARVRFDPKIIDREIVILDQGRVRVVDGAAIGRPATRPVELRTGEGDFVLRSADIEVKTAPKTDGVTPLPTLVKLNLGDARLGGLPVTRDVVHGIVGGKVLDRVIPIGDIALPTLRQDPAPSKAAAAPGRIAGPAALALPVIDLPATEPKPFVAPVALSPAIVSPGLGRTTQSLASPAPTDKLVATPTPEFKPVLLPPIVVAPVVTGSALILAKPIQTTTGTTSFDVVAKEIKASPTVTPKVIVPLNTAETLKPSTTFLGTKQTLKR